MELSKQEGLRVTDSVLSWRQTQARHKQYFVYADNNCFPNLSWVLRIPCQGLPYKNTNTSTVFKGRRSCDNNLQMASAMQLNSLIISTTFPRNNSRDCGKNLRRLFSSKCFNLHDDASNDCTKQDLPSILPRNFRGFPQSLLAKAGIGYWDTTTAYNRADPTAQTNQAAAHLTLILAFS